MSANPIRALVTVCVATAMLMLDIAVINSALPRVAHDLHADLSGVAWVIDAYTLALAAVVLSAGSIADRYGRRRIFLAGLGLFTLSSLACSLSTTMIQLDLARAVQGVGAAAMFSTSLALLGDAYPVAADRAKALAVYGATIGASFAVGPLVGGALTSWFGWRSVFLLNVPIGIACAVATRAVPESRDAHPRRLDWTGQVLAGAALFLVVLALLRGNVVGWTVTSTVAELVAAGVLAILFLVSQTQVREPMLPLSMFGNRTFSALQAVAFSISASLFAIFMYAMFYLQGVLGLSPIESGAAWIPGTIIMVVVSGVTSTVLQRVDARYLLAAGMALVTAGLAAMFVLEVDSSWWSVLPGEIVALIGCGIVNPVLSGLVLTESAGQRQALAVGVNDAARQTGLALGVAVLGTFVPATISSPADTLAYVHGLHQALWVAVGLAAVGVVVAAFAIRPTRVPALTDEPTTVSGPADAPVLVTV